MLVTKTIPRPDNRDHARVSPMYRNTSFHRALMMAGARKEMRNYRTCTDIFRYLNRNSFYISLNIVPRPAMFSTGFVNEIIT